MLDLYDYIQFSLYGFFIAIGILGDKEYDFLGILIVSVVVIWQFYRVFKFYLVTEFKSQTEKEQCWIHSFVSGIIIAIVLIWLGIVSKVEFIDLPYSIQVLILVPLISFERLSKWLHSFLIKPIEVKKNKLRTWFYASLFSLSIVGFLYGGAATSKKYFHPLFIFLIWILSFLGFSRQFDTEKGKEITKITKLLCIIFFLLTIALWFELLTMKF